MTYKIHKWIDIQDKYTDSLLIGNGASIAVNPSFTYKTLLGHAKTNRLITESCQRVFDYFGTDDFELILRLVWQTTNVNKSLEVVDLVTEKAYRDIRSSLIQSVRGVHPDHAETERHLPSIARFARRFDTVFSLNYDIILYWAHQWSNASSVHREIFKDCFNYGEFQNNWREYRKPYREERKVTLVFYPHGNLCFARDMTEEEFKIRADISDLLSDILSSWENGTCVPLFVSEGTQKQKISSINGSNYLNTVYRQVLPSEKTSLAVYGWGLWETDLHIMEALQYSGLQRIAFSTSNSPSGQEYCERVAPIVRKYLPHAHVEFYDRASPGCWNNPL